MRVHSPYVWFRVSLIAASVLVHMPNSSDDAGGKSGATRTSNNPLEASRREKPQYFVDVVKVDRRTKNNDLEFIIGGRDFPNPIHDKREPLPHLTVSEHMTREFNKKWEQDCLITSSKRTHTHTHTHTHTLPTHSLTHLYIYTLSLVSHTPIHQNYFYTHITSCLALAYQPSTMLISALC